MPKRLTSSSNLNSRAIEVDPVLHNMLVLLHLKILEKGFCIPLQVKRHKFLLKLHPEEKGIQEEIWKLHSMFHIQKIRLKLSHPVTSILNLRHIQIIQTFRSYFLHLISFPPLKIIVPLSFFFFCDPSSVFLCSDYYQTVYSTSPVIPLTTLYARFTRSPYRTRDFK